MRSHIPLLLAAALPLAPVHAAPAPLQDHAALALSPAGDRVATIDSVAQNDGEPAPHGTIVLRAAADGHVLTRIDPCGECSYSGLAFGPAGQLAFIQRDPRSGTASLRVATGRAVRTVAVVNGLAARPRWSPDGSRIAILATPSARKETGATQAGVRQVGEIGEQNDEQRIAIVPAMGGALRLVSPADRFVYEYDWTPDGRGFVATSALGNGDANWWVATIDAIDATSGAVRTIARPTTQANAPRVSPDGRTVAYIGGLMSDFGSVGGDVWTVPFAGGTPVDLTPGFRGTFTSLDWTRGGLRGTALIDDRAAIVPLDLEHGAGSPSWSAPVSIAADDAQAGFADDGDRVAFVAQDFTHGAAIYAGPAARPVAITHDNDGFGAIAQARSLHWRNDGRDVQGWLLTPLGTPSGAMPMIVQVHGGPAAATVPRFVWKGVTAALLRHGYALFMPNPRGSYGQGEAFTTANRRDFGGGDLRDILAGVDAAEKAAPIDDARLGLMGGSYGGFMAMWANTRTDRFKAIWAAAGLSDWISYYGTNGINEWMIPYFGKSMYDDTKPYWDVSAIRTIAAAKTPTLITVGERDIEVPPTQSVEYWTALRAHGVPTTLVIYPDEGHAIRAPDHVADVERRVTAWFQHYLGR